MLTLNDYQKRAAETATYPKGNKNNWYYPALGLVGEAGEVANKVKKIIRDDDGTLFDDRALEIADELGDVLWYVAALAKEIGWDLNEVAQHNLEKLARRKQIRTLQSTGDAR